MAVVFRPVDFAPSRHGKMYRLILVLLAVVSALHGSLSKQVPMEDGGPISLVTDAAQLEELQKNISALWSYIHELRGAVTHHLNHLRQHQIEMEESIHRIEHHSHGESHAAAHTAGHSHSGEDHAHRSSSHSGEDHAHRSSSHSGEDHAHGSSSHSGEDHHHHSGEHHHHSGEHHSHSGEHHDSHSHTDGDHAHKDDHSHGHAHKDSHEDADDLQQTPHGSEPLPEQVIVASTRPPSNYHHHHSSHSHGGSINLMGEDQFLGASRSRNRTVAMPKLSDSQLYDFAVCDVAPNKALSLEQQQNIVGKVSFWQKKTGGPLNIHVHLSGFSMGDHHAHQQGHHEEEEDSNDTDAPPPMVHKHGFHIHALADIANGCQGAGPHYNPKGVTHGGPKSLLRHAGDLGNIECDDHGIANLAFSDQIASLRGPYSVVGKSVVVHAVADDLGLGGDDESLKTGNAGARLACCVIEKVERLSYRSYKAMKTVLQHKNY